MEQTVTIIPPQAIRSAGELDADLFTRWESFIDASPRTVNCYRESLRHFVSFLQDNGITAPARGDVLAYKKELLLRLKPATVNAYLAAVRQFFRWTEQEGFYPDVSAGLKGAKLDKEHKKDALSIADCTVLLNLVDRSTTRGIRDYAMLCVMLTGGLRCVEIVRANVEDVEIIAGTPRLYVLGKGRTERNEFVNLPRQTFKAIREWIDLREREEGHKAGGKEPLFTGLSNNGKGTRLTGRAVSAIAKEALRRAGYDSDRITAHSLRHTAITAALEAGEDIREVMRFARHSNIQTTLIYAHDLEKKQNHCAETVASLIFAK